MGHRLGMTSRGFLQPHGELRGTGNSFYPTIGLTNKGRFRETGWGGREVGVPKLGLELSTVWGGLCQLITA